MGKSRLVVQSYITLLPGQARHPETTARHSRVVLEAGDEVSAGTSEATLVRTE